MYMKCYRMRDQKKKSGMSLSRFHFRFYQFRGLFAQVRCDEINPCSMQSFAENKGYSDRRDSGLDTACKRWTVSYRCSSFRRKKTSSTDLDIRDHNSFCWGRGDKYHVTINPPVFDKV